MNILVMLFKQICWNCLALIIYYAYCLSLLADLFPGVDINEEPNFIISEKEQFKTYRDKDGDGFLDIAEV